MNVCKMSFKGEKLDIFELAFKKLDNVTDVGELINKAVQIREYLDIHPLFTKSYLEGSCNIKPKQKKYLFSRYSNFFKVVNNKTKEVEMVNLRTITKHYSVIDSDAEYTIREEYDVVSDNYYRKVFKIDGSSISDEKGDEILDMASEKMEGDYNV